MPQDNNFETRYYPLTELRFSEAGEEPRIAGTAAVYEQESEDLGFIEIIERGFFRDVLNLDVRGLFNHDPNLIFGRSKSGTLRLIDGDEGLGFEADPPQSRLVDDYVLTPMRRGDVDQCSFSFRVNANGDRWEKREDGTIVRRLLPGGCQELRDVSVVTFPAYPQTNAEVRAKFAELSDQQPGETDEIPGAGQESEDDGGSSTQARLDIQRRRLELAELE